MKLENVKVALVNEVETGKSQDGNEWKKQTVIVTTGGQYPKTIAVSCMGKTVDYSSQLKVGQTIDVEFDVQSREYNGRWYTDVKAWKITAQTGSTNVPASEAVSATTPEGKSNDLPF